MGKNKNLNLAVFQVVGIFALLGSASIGFAAESTSCDAAPVDVTIVINSIETLQTVKKNKVISTSEGSVDYGAITYNPDDSSCGQFGCWDNEPNFSESPVLPLSSPITVYVPEVLDLGTITLGNGKVTPNDAHNEVCLQKFKAMKVGYITVCDDDPDSGCGDGGTVGFGSGGGKTIRLHVVPPLTLKGQAQICGSEYYFVTSQFMSCELDIPGF